jgi:hypothetical protein
VSMSEIRITSWNELHERLYENSWQAGLGRFRSTHVFRGMACAGRGLETSLMRLGSGHAALEEHLLRSFRRYARRYDVPADSIWNWLALAQHHSLPSRLLDWTYSPLVALHFVTANLEHYGEDGVVWCVDYAATNRLLPERLTEALEREGAGIFTTELLSEVAGSLREFDRLAERPFAVFFEPPSLDDRIVNQYALFSLMSSASARFDDWLACLPGSHHRLVIPAALKWEIRDKLDQSNITERVLFPGLDGLSCWLRRYYTPRVLDGDAADAGG